MRLVFGLVFCFLIALAACEQAPAADATAPEIPLEKMKIKELRKMLEERGVECHGCKEKSDLVERVKETMHLPILEKPAPGDLPEGIPKPDYHATPEQLNDVDIEAILQKMRDDEAKKADMYEKLRAQGININPEQNGGGSKEFEKLLRNAKRKAPKKPAAKDEL
eukprot:TRINITY_DN3356_c0_g1_i1.p2 TRINITY_DN3356_c0_g1~~TRINITY_DN3356_c0_g1_i1.p2  ORF type:complete len:165 (-),score=47.22 TRINITY_DN3356_c0_g1_i1:65-559(-)